MLVKNKNGVISDVLYLSRALRRTLMEAEDIICRDCKKHICECCVLDKLDYAYNAYSDVLDKFLEEAIIEKNWR